MYPNRSAKNGLAHRAIRHTELAGSVRLFSPRLWRECNHGDDPLGTAPILGEGRIPRGLALVDFVVLGTFDFLRSHVDDLVPYLDLDVRVRLEIEVPIWVGIGSCFRCEDNVAVAVLEIITGLIRSLPLLAPLWRRSNNGAPWNGPPTFPWFLRNSAIVCAFQSLRLPLIVFAPSHTQQS